MCDTWTYDEHSFCSSYCMFLWYRSKNFFEHGKHLCCLLRQYLSPVNKILLMLKKRYTVSYWSFNHAYSGNRFIAGLTFLRDLKKGISSIKRFNHKPKKNSCFILRWLGLLQNPVFK